MSPSPRKKLIEVSMPLEAINAASAREKSIRHGHPSTLHLWWARRPLAACRAVIFAQLVDDPGSWPDRFPTKAEQDAERDRLHKVIADMVEWPKSTAADQARWERALDAARYEIARSFAWGRGEEPPMDRAGVLAYLAEHAPPVYDPFCGGGSIPLEAQRLGLRAYGSDLNPVPVLISKALVEIPPKFADLAPVHPATGNELLEQPWAGAESLAEDVRFYGRWMRDQAKQRIGHLYPDATLPNGQKATVIAWLWARTVRSPDPAARGAMVPLASSFVLSSKEGREAIVRVVRDAAAPDGWRFAVQQGGVSAADLATAKEGTQASRGANFTCALTGAALKADWIKREGAAGRMSVRLMAIVAEGDRGRAYLSPTSDHAAAAQRAQPAWKPDAALPDDPRNFWTIPYGLRTYGDLFTDRQLVALTTLCDLVGEARARVLADAEEAFLKRGPSPYLANTDRGPLAYADAVATYLAFVASKISNVGSSITSWMNDRGAFRETFARQAIPMAWDFAEANPFAEAGGSLDTTLDKIAMAIAAAPTEGEGTIVQINASANSYPIRPVVISTDPPYYDNIGYADLSDFFYVWLRRSLGNIWPDLFRRLQTPKAEELVATPYRHGGKTAAEAHFMGGMSRALTAMRNAGAPDIPLAIYYAFKQSEKSEGGVSSAGWASFLQAIVDSGLMVDGTWPMRTESPGRLIGKDTNALASSIVLVCRPRPTDARTATQRDFVAELRRELPEALQHMRAAGTHPVDIPQSALGPGMAVFSKYALVRKTDDAPMSVARALTLINQIRGEIDHADSGDLDPPTRFALDWFENFGWGTKPAGEAIKLAQSYDLAEKGLRDAGVLTTDRGDARLVRREDIPGDWRPSRGRMLTGLGVGTGPEPGLERRRRRSRRRRPVGRGARDGRRRALARPSPVRHCRGSKNDRRGARLGPPIGGLGGDREGGRPRLGVRGRPYRRSVLGANDRGRRLEQNPPGEGARTCRPRSASVRRPGLAGTLWDELASARPDAGRRGARRAVGFAGLSAAVPE
jgi:putative DNA methylase